MHLAAFRSGLTVVSGLYGRVLVAAALLFFFAAPSNAALIQFEGFAPAGGVANVNPGAPYLESGFLFTPLNANSAVFDAAAVSRFPGDNTSWFGFAGGNDITMTGPTRFNLTSLLVGPSTIGVGNINLTLIGHVFGGGTLSASFNTLTTATVESLNWINLTDVTFSVSSDAGLDNILATAVPEPGPWLLMGMGLGTLAVRRRRRVCGLGSRRNGW